MMKIETKTKNQKANIKFYILPFVILISICFLGVGYAALNATLNISGELGATAQTGVFISNVNYNGDTNANSSYYGTLLNSTVVLPKNDGSSSITYNVTVYNNSDKIMRYVDTVYGNQFYDNENIVFEVSGIDNDTLLDSTKKSVTFSITFHYKNNTAVSNNVLNSSLNFEFEEFSANYSYAYTGAAQNFTAPATGVYKVELWGAEGGGDYGGAGGYTSGKIKLSKDTKMYVYVGEHHERGELDTAFNGGGLVLAESSKKEYPNRYNTGGGSTDIRLVNGTWSTFNSLKSRIMVAGAGGGCYQYFGNSTLYIYGGAGGGLTGIDGKIAKYDPNDILQAATGGTQTSGGKRGVGTNTSFKGVDGAFGKAGTLTAKYLAGGGSGYYGGGSSGVNNSISGTGAGGSSFISGHNGCNAIGESSTSSNIVHTGQSVHYSNYQFTDTVMIDGDGYKWTTTKGTSVVGMPNYDGTGTMTGNIGHGYAKITYVSVE